MRSFVFLQTDHFFDVLALSSQMLTSHDFCYAFLPRMYFLVLVYLLSISLVQTSCALFTPSPQPLERRVIHSFLSDLIAEHCSSLDRRAIFSSWSHILHYYFFDSCGSRPSLAIDDLARGLIFLFLLRPNVGVARLPTLRDLSAQLLAHLQTKISLQIRALRLRHFLFDNTVALWE